MKVCFIGVGSIAKRHIRNLKDLRGDNVDITVVRRENSVELEEPLKDMISRTLFTNDKLDRHYDAIFITNPTAFHYKTLQQYFAYSDFFFIEKPIFMTGKEDLKVFLNTAKTYYVACPLRYTNVIQYLKNNIDFSSFYSIRCISSSYLPDWRPGIDYRKSYSALKKMGGGVSVDLIHEWDYLHYLIGLPKSIHSIISKKSDLDIDSDDIAVYIAEYQDKVVELHLDYFGRKTVRKIEMIGREDTIIADLISQKIEWLRKEKIIDLDQNRDDYQKKELKHFLDIVDGKCSTDNSIETACEILRVARGGI